MQQPDINLMAQVAKEWQRRIDETRRTQNIRQMERIQLPHHAGTVCEVAPKDRPMNRQTRGGKIKERYLWNEELQKHIQIAPHDAFQSFLKET